MDANLVLNWLLPDERSETADAAQQELAAQGYELVAPPLLYVEVASVLRNAVHFGRLSVGEGEAAFERFRSFGIESVNHGELHIQAWSIARDFKMTKAYDAQYLALAEILGCDVWTMDERLVNATQGRFTHLRRVT
jgi:predicted nucleic acid-binding protein